MPAYTGQTQPLFLLQSLPKLTTYTGFPQGHDMHAGLLLVGDRTYYKAQEQGGFSRTAGNNSWERTAWEAVPEVIWATAEAQQTRLTAVSRVQRLPVKHPPPGHLIHSCARMRLSCCSIPRTKCHQQSPE